jgi:hypothetical protein
MEVEATRRMTMKREDDENGGGGHRPGSNTGKVIRESCWNASHEYQANHAEKAPPRH